MPAKQKQHSGVGKGQAQPPNGTAHHFGLQAHQQAAGWPNYSRPLPSCQAHIRLLLTPMADLLLLKATFVAAKSRWHLCMLLLRGKSVHLSSNTASCQPCQHAPRSFGKGLELRGWGSGLG